MLRGILEGGRVGRVDHRVGAGQGLYQSLAGDGVYAERGRCGRHLMALVAHELAEPRTDESVAIHYYDLHR
jgi:hypothetical protein